MVDALAEGGGHVWREGEGEGLGGVGKVVGRERKGEGGEFRGEDGKERVGGCHPCGDDRGHGPEDGRGDVVGGEKRGQLCVVLPVLSVPLDVGVWADVGTVRAHEEGLAPGGACDEVAGADGDQELRVEKGDGSGL